MDLIGLILTIVGFWVHTKALYIVALACSFIAFISYAKDFSENASNTEASVFFLTVATVVINIVRLCI